MGDFSDEGYDVGTVDFLNCSKEKGCIGAVGWGGWEGTSS